MDLSLPEAATRPAETAPDRRRRVSRLIAWIVVAAAIVVGVVGGLHRALNDEPDWRDLAAEVRYVWQHEHTAPGTAMFGYLPTATFVLWPFMAWTPLPIGAGLYLLSNVLAAVGSIWIVRRWWLPDRPAGASFVWPVLLICVNFAHAIQANQLTLWTLFLCVAGLALVERRHGLSGGLLLGLAMLIKTMPAVLGVYLLLRRRWFALLGVIAAIVLFDALPSVAFFGWRGAIDEHQAWLRRAGWHSNLRQIEEPLLWAHRHGSNASYAAVLTRWLRGVPDAQRQVILYGQPPAEVVEQTRAALAPGEILTFDPMPPREGQWEAKRVDVAWVPRFHVAELSAETVRWIWGGTLAAGLAALAWATWKRSRRAVATSGRTDGYYGEQAGIQAAPKTEQPIQTQNWAPIAALWILTMFWPSPMARHYYLAWAFPALAVVWCTLERELPARGFRWRAGMRLAGAALVAWVAGVACIGWLLARWYGVHLAALALLMAATAWAWHARNVAGRDLRDEHR
jgi:hypothetical protein